MKVMIKMSYQIVKGIVKVIRPNGKNIIGIADGEGQFVWIPTENIIDSFPPELENWQTTIFRLKPDSKIKWRPEQRWEDFKADYPIKVIPTPEPIPNRFLYQFQPAMQPIQQPIENQLPPIQPIKEPTAFHIPVPQQSVYNQSPANVSISQESQAILYELREIKELLNTIKNSVAFIVIEYAKRENLGDIAQRVGDRIQEEEEKELARNNLIITEEKIEPSPEVSNKKELPEVFQ